MVGLKDEKYLEFFQHQPEVVARLQKAMNQMDLRTTYVVMLRKLGFDLPEGAEFQQDDPNSREAILKVVKEVYEDSKNHLPLYLLTEELISLDQQLSHWREHHVRVVERVIGFKRGTGGSSGVGYLRGTTDKRVFPILWDVRTVLEKR